MNYCSNCGKKNEHDENFCGNCGRGLKETIEVYPVEMTGSVRNFSSKDTSGFSFLNRNAVANILAALIIIYFYKELLTYMDYFDDRAGTVFRLLLMIGIFSGLLILHYKKSSRSIWIPGIISCLLAVRCFAQYKLFKEYVAWTETQGYNTQMSVESSAAGALTAYGLVYSIFIVSVLMIYLIHYRNSIPAANVPNN